jgi:hypothetical protein
MKNKKEMELKDMPKKAKYVILEDGTKIDLDKTSHFLCYQENENNNSIDFNISHMSENDNITKMLSNQAYMFSNTFKLMSKMNLDFETAFEMHVDFIEKARKMRKKDLQ